IRDLIVTGVQTCALPISSSSTSTPIALVELIKDPITDSNCKETVMKRIPILFSFLLLAAAIRPLPAQTMNPSGEAAAPLPQIPRSEERRVGKECRSRGPQ